MLERLILNWPLKILAVALAFIVWASVTSERPIVEDFTVPLDLQLPASRILAEDPPKTINVRLRGAESLMPPRDRIRMEMLVDLQEIALGNSDVQLNRDGLSGVPRGIKVDFMDPDRVSLVVDRRERRELPVEATFLGQPPEGFAFYGARVEPALLTIEGPSSEVAPLDLVPTNPIRLDQRRQSFTLNVAAVPGGPNVRVIDPSSVEVRVAIDTSPEERELKDIPVQITGASSAYEVSPGLVDLVLRGPSSLIDSIQPSQIQLTADISAFEPGQSVPDLPVRAVVTGLAPELAPRVNVKQIRPRTVSVRSLEGRR